MQKKRVCILALVFGELSISLSFSLVAASRLLFWQKVLCNQVFLLTAVLISRLVGLLLRGKQRLHNNTRSIPMFGNAPFSLIGFKAAASIDTTATDESDKTHSITTAPFCRAVPAVRGTAIWAAARTRQRLAL